MEDESSYNRSNYNYDNCITNNRLERIDMKKNTLYIVTEKYPITGYYTPTAGSKGNGKQFIERLNKNDKQPAEWR